MDTLCVRTHHIPIALSKSAEMKYWPKSMGIQALSMQRALLPAFKTALVSVLALRCVRGSSDRLIDAAASLQLCFVVCLWDFVLEIQDPPDCNAHSSWRTWLLIAPHSTLLLLLYLLQLALAVRFRARLHLAVGHLLGPRSKLAFPSTHSGSVDRGCDGFAAASGSADARADRLPHGRESLLLLAALVPHGCVE